MNENSLSHPLIPLSWPCIQSPVLLRAQMYNPPSNYALKCTAPVLLRAQVYNPPSYYALKCTTLRPTTRSSVQPPFPSYYVLKCTTPVLLCAQVYNSLPPPVPLRAQNVHQYLSNPTCPFFKPTNRPSFPGGPPITFMYLINDSMFHSLRGKNGFSLVLMTSPD